MKKILFVLVSAVLVSCGSKDDCPTNGINTTNPNCPNYNPYYSQQYPNYQQPCQPGTPNCVNGYYQNPSYQQPCQPGTPNCVNGYYQYPSYQQPCQPGTPNCVNGYYQYPGNQYPGGQYPYYPQQPRY